MERENLSKAELIDSLNKQALSELNALDEKFKDGKISFDDYENRQRYVKEGLRNQLKNLGIKL